MLVGEDGQLFMAFINASILSATTYEIDSYYEQTDNSESNSASVINQTRIKLTLQTKKKKCGAPDPKLTFRSEWSNTWKLYVSDVNLFFSSLIGALDC